eukprot:3908844-Alexandrium_andersonii.AAC.1
MATQENQERCPTQTLSPSLREQDQDFDPGFDIDEDGRWRERSPRTAEVESPGSMALAELRHSLRTEQREQDEAARDFRGARED